MRAGVWQVWRHLEEDAFAGFTPDERLLLRRFLVQIRENLKQVTVVE